MIINRIYENQNLLSLQLVSFLVGLRTYQHSCNEHTADTVSKCNAFRKACFQSHTEHTLHLCIIPICLIIQSVL